MMILGLFFQLGLRALLQKTSNRCCDRRAYLVLACAGEMTYSLAFVAVVI